MENEKDKLQQLENAHKAKINLRLPTLFASMRDAILIEDENRMVVIANESFCKMFNILVSPDLLVGMDCSESAEQTKALFVDPESFIQRINQILQNKNAVYNEVIELEDGRVLERDYVPILHEETFAGQLWQYRDITEKAKAQKTLIAREQKYRSIIENMNLGLLEVDTKENILYANTSFCKQTGYKIEEIIGKKASELFLPVEELDLMIDVQERRKRGTSDAYEIQINNKHGLPIWMLVSGAPIIDENNKLVGSIGIHLDISSRKQLEKELVQSRLRAESASRTREEFLAMVSHEVRTPLAAIIGLQNILFKEMLFPSQKKLVEQTLHAGDHLMNIINNILDFSKLSSGKMELSTSHINLTDTIEKTISMLSVRAEEKGLEITSKIDNKLAKAHIADGPRIAQILVNLLGNAIKFTETGYVKLQLEVAKEEADKQLLIIRVQDSGIGITEEQQKSIFNVFNQADASISRKYGGTGLGLSISKYLAELMGGKIWVGSEIGKGTSFYLQISLKKGDVNHIIIPESQELLVGQLAKFKILIAEDNEINMLIAQTILSRQEARIDQAVNGKIALEMALKNDYDLILMDIQMPELNGSDATKRLRKAGKNLPIIALTANALTKKDELMQEAGFTDVITKPFSEYELISRVLKWLNPLNKLTVKEAITDIKLKEDEKIYSLNRLRKLAQNDEVFIAKMVKMAKTQLMDVVEQIKLASESKEWNQVAAQAHKIKATLDSLEAQKLTEKARKIEMNSPESMTQEEYITLINEFSNELIAFGKALE